MEVAMRSFSIDEWCELHGFSRSFFYKLDRKSEAPKTFTVGTCRRISEDANREWIAARESAVA
jgi:predicted DNA-binding transcriptional regulator AlpA